MGERRKARRTRWAMIWLMRLPGLVATAIALAQCGAAADHPCAQFANELIEMQMCLLDPENGHYE